MTPVTRVRLGPGSGGRGGDIGGYLGGGAGGRADGLQEPDVRGYHAGWGRGSASCHIVCRGQHRHQRHPGRCAQAVLRPRREGEEFFFFLGGGEAGDDSLVVVVLVLVVLAVGLVLFLAVVVIVVGGGRAYSFVACLGHLTIDHASLARRSTVPTANRDTSNIWALITLLPYITVVAGGGSNILGCTNV